MMDAQNAQRQERTLMQTVEDKPGDPDNGEAVPGQGQGANERSLYFPPNFAVNLKLL